MGRCGRKRSVFESGGLFRNSEQCVAPGCKRLVVNRITAGRADVGKFGQQLFGKCDILRWIFERQRPVEQVVKPCRDGRIVALSVGYEEQEFDALLAKIEQTLGN